MAEVVPIAKEPTYRASDIVTRITLAMEVGSGQLGFETHVVRDAPEEDFRQAISKLFDAAEWQRAKYNIRALEATMQQAEQDLARFRADRESYLAKLATEWTHVLKRKGDLKLTGSQESHIVTQDNSIQKRIDEIADLRKKVAITKAILEGTQ